MLAWSNQRFNEALECYDHTFGGIPMVNFFGDLGQLGPIGDKDLHEPPNSNDSPEKTAGYAIYRSFNNVIILSQTMRQGPDQLSFLNLLLRVRNGTITQQDWIDLNNRCEKALSSDEKNNFNHDRVITLMETWAEVNEENHYKLTEKGIPVAVIPSIGSGRHHTQNLKQCGQIVNKSLVAVGTTVILTKNQKGLTQYGLNNGAIGKVISMLYDENTTSPEFPSAVVVEFPGCKGPPWIPQFPKWVPIPVDEGRCDTNCCARKGLPLMPGYAIPIAKSQGMTIGAHQPATHCRIKLQSRNMMQKLSLGTTYTALSRVESNQRWTLVEKIPQERLCYINDHPRMKSRKQEENRLKELSEKTLTTYGQDKNTDKFIELLHEFDECCNDNVQDATCNTNDPDCPHPVSEGVSKCKKYTMAETFSNVFLGLWRFHNK